MADDNKIIPQADGTENKKIRMNFGGADIEAAVDKDGRIIMPEEIQNIMAAGMAVMEKRLKARRTKHQRPILHNHPNLEMKAWQENSRGCLCAN